MPDRADEPQFNCPHGLPWNECDDCTAEWDVLDLAEFPEWGSEL